MFFLTTKYNISFPSRLVNSLTGLKDNEIDISSLEEEEISIGAFLTDISSCAACAICDHLHEDFELFLVEPELSCSVCMFVVCSSMCQLVGAAEEVFSR